MSNIKITAVILCAGSGSRSKQQQNKIFCKIDGEPIILKTIKPFLEVSQISDFIIVYKQGELEQIKALLKDVSKPIIYIEGGNTRYNSVINALNALTEGGVLIHDGARPFITANIIKKVVQSLIKYGSGVTCIPSTDTVIETDINGDIISSSRTNKYLAQTPQAFMVKDIKKAYGFSNESDCFTDDAGVYTSFIGKCKLVEGDITNVKLTYPSDFSDLGLIRVGNGFDLHKLVENRKLILGGVEIPHVKGLLGHSDADVLTHALMDALLSSLSLRDIGYHFSDKDQKYKDISSMVLLEKVLKMISAKGYKPNNVSAVIMAEKPKMSAFIPEITKNLSTALSIPEENIGITLTTLEGIGIVGREEGIACSCYVTVKPI